MKTTKLAWECGARAAPEGNTLWCWQSDALGTGSLFSSQGAICLVTLFYTPLQVTARTRRPLRLPAGPAAPCPLQVNPCSRSALCEPRAASLRSPRQPAALACGAQKLWDAVAGWRGERCHTEAPLLRYPLLPTRRCHWKCPSARSPRRHQLVLGLHLPHCTSTQPYGRRGASSRTKCSFTPLR